MVFGVLGSKEVEPLVSDGGWTILHYAAKGELEVVKSQMQHGAEVDAQLDDGSTVLLLAALNQKWDWLVEHGADVNTADNAGWTILHSAASSGKLDVVKSLVE